MFAPVLECFGQLVAPELIFCGTKLFRPATRIKSRIVTKTAVVDLGRQELCDPIGPTLWQDYGGRYRAHRLRTTHAGFRNVACSRYRGRFGTLAIARIGVGNIHAYHSPKIWSR